MDKNEILIFPETPGENIDNVDKAKRLQQAWLYAAQHYVPKYDNVFEGAYFFVIRRLQRANRALRNWYFKAR